MHVKFAKIIVFCCGQSNNVSVWHLGISGSNPSVPCYIQYNFYFSYSKIHGNVLCLLQVELLCSTPKGGWLVWSFSDPLMWMNLVTSMGEQLWAIHMYNEDKDSPKKVLLYCLHWSCLDISPLVLNYSTAKSANKCLWYFSGCICSCIFFWNSFCGICLILIEWSANSQK